METKEIVVQINDLEYYYFKEHRIGMLNRAKGIAGMALLDMISRNPSSRYHYIDTTVRTGNGRDVNFYVVTVGIEKWGKKSK